jgi:hypothetical protein
MWSPARADEIEVLKDRHRELDVVRVILQSRAVRSEIEGIAVVGNQIASLVSKRRCRTEPSEGAAD